MKKEVLVTNDVMNMLIQKELVVPFEHNKQNKVKDLIVNGELIKARKQENPATTKFIESAIDTPGFVYLNTGINTINGGLLVAFSSNADADELESNHVYLPSVNPFVLDIGQKLVLSYDNGETSISFNNDDVVAGDEESLKIQGFKNFTGRASIKDDNTKKNMVLFNKNIINGEFLLSVNVLYYTEQRVLRKEVSETFKDVTGKKYMKTQIKDVVEKHPAFDVWVSVYENNIDLSMPYDLSEDEIKTLETIDMIAGIVDGEVYLHPIDSSLEEDEVQYEKEELLSCKRDGFGNKILKGDADIKAIICYPDILKIRKKRNIA